jgi:hypothetical protein
LIHQTQNVSAKNVLVLIAICTEPSERTRTLKVSFHNIELKENTTTTTIIIITIIIVIMLRKHLFLDLELYLKFKISKSCFKLECKERSHFKVRRGNSQTVGNILVRQNNLK